MRKPSPLVNIPGLGKTAVAAAGAVPTVFVDISTQGVYSQGGKVTEFYNATIPLWQQYDTGRFVFSAITVGAGDLTGLTVELWGRDSQEISLLLGSTELSAEETLPRINDIPISGQMQYAIRVAGLTFVTTGSISFSVFAQGYFRDDN